jgi:hypothetical protein
MRIQGTVLVLHSDSVSIFACCLSATSGSDSSSRPMQQIYLYYRSMAGEATRPLLQNPYWTCFVPRQDRRQCV